MLYENPRLQIMNLHLTRHLPEQCRRFGPLFVFSAMGFESANRTLANLFSGTRSHVDVICRRYLEKQRIMTIDLEDDSALGLARDWTGQNCVEESIKGNFLLQTPVVKQVKNLHPSSTILSRHIVDGVLFNSTSYARAPAGPNSYVAFERDDELCFGPIECFVVFGEDDFSSFSSTVAVIKKIEALSIIKPEIDVDIEPFFEVSVTSEMISKSI